MMFGFADIIWGAYPVEQVICDNSNIIFLH